MPSVVEIEQRLITNQVIKRLNHSTLADVKVYDTEIPDGVHPPTLEDDDEGRVAPYVVVNPFGPAPTAENDLGLEGIDQVYTVQLRLTAGYRADCEHLLFRVVPRFRGWAPTLEAANCGLFMPPAGFTPGTIQRSPRIVPPRFFVPLQYRTTITAT